MRLTAAAPKSRRFAWRPVLCVVEKGHHLTRAGWYWLNSVVVTVDPRGGQIAYRTDNGALRPLPDLVLTLASFVGLAALTALTGAVLSPWLLRFLGQMG